MTYTTQERATVPTPPNPFVALRDVFDHAALSHRLAVAFQVVHVHASCDPYQQLCAILRFLDARLHKTGGYHTDPLHGAAFAPWGEPDQWAWDTWATLQAMASDFLGDV